MHTSEDRGQCGATNSPNLGLRDMLGIWIGVRHCMLIYLLIIMRLLSSYVDVLAFLVAKCVIRYIQGLRVQRSARNGVLEIIRRVRRNSPIARKRRRESWNGLRDRHQWVRIRVYGEFCPNWPKLSTQNFTRYAGKLTRGAQPGSRLIPQL